MHNIKTSSHPFTFLDWPSRLHKKVRKEWVAWQCNADNFFQSSETGSSSATFIPILSLGATGGQTLTSDTVSSHGILGPALAWQL